MAAVEVPQTLEYMGGQLNAAPILEDFQDSLDDEDDTRSSHEYLNDLEEEYQARALLAKSKRFFKKVSTYQSPFKLKPLSSSQHKPELRPTKDFDAKYNKVKAKLALLSSSSSSSKAFMRILGVDQLTKDPSSSGLKDLVFVKSSADDTKMTIPGVERPWLSKVEGFIPPNHNTDESTICSIPLPPLKKLDGAEPISGPKTIKSILRSKSTFKVEALKNVTINEPSPAPAKACGSPNHTTTDHYDIKWFKRGEALQAKKVEALKSTRAESLNANRSKTLTKSGCSRHMTGVKSYLHKYMEQPGPKVVFGDDFTCTTKGYSSIKCNGIVFTKFDEKSGTIINSNKKIVMIALQKDIYLMNIFILINLLKEDTSAQNTTILSPPLPIPSMVTPAPQNRWSQDKHIEFVNIIGNPRAEMLTRAMAKQLSTALAHECLFVDFIFEEEPKKVSEALKHPGWVDAMQDELN
nr:retrovirus-related Pol polyprotein from transposon TNT 1-94 [Tanacetum cinerariifolium]